MALNLNNNICQKISKENLSKFAARPLAFNFTYLTRKKKYCGAFGGKNCFSQKQAAKLFEKLLMLSTHTVSTALDLPKESGFERIEKSEINGPLKNFSDVCVPQHLIHPTVDENQDAYWIVRFNGPKCRLIGQLLGNVYFVQYIDPDLSLYNHG